MFRDNQTMIVRQTVDLINCGSYNPNRKSQVVPVDKAPTILSRDCKGVSDRDIGGGVGNMETIKNTVKFLQVDNNNGQYPPIIKFDKISPTIIARTYKGAGRFSYIGGVLEICKISK